MQYSGYKKEKRIQTLIPKKGMLQRPWLPEGLRRHRQPPKKVPIILPKPDFMPSYLVRTSDMKLVPGSQVHEGYCALSYCWNQSGKIIKTETDGKDVQRVDQGKHEIMFPPKTVRKSPRGRKRIPGKIKFVSFKGLIQEICKDFNIKYIWYDQMCINQDDDGETHREIRQMHKIYSNAYCTIALVPELTVRKRRLYYSSPLTFPEIDILRLHHSEWMKRIWTLHETLMSTKMILIGTDTHWWSHEIPSFVFGVFGQNCNYNIPRVLYHAHARASTKRHDHVFALANIFPDSLKEITINYKQDL